MKMSKILALVCLIAMTGAGSACADGARVFKSIVFPGMGQLGDDQKVKGVGFMVTEVVMLHLVFSELSKTNAYAYETRRLKIQYDLDTNYTDKKKRHEDWTAAYDNASSAKNKIFIFAGLAGACWGINLVDALIFAPRGGGRVEVLDKVRDHLVVNVRGDGTTLGFTTEF